MVLTGPFQSEADQEVLLGAFLEARQVVIEPVGILLEPGLNGLVDVRGLRRPGEGVESVEALLDAFGVVTACFADSGQDRVGLRVITIG